MVGETQTIREYINKNDEEIDFLRRLHLVYLSLIQISHYVRNDGAHFVFTYSLFFQS